MKASIGISVVGKFLNDANGKCFSDYIQKSSFHMAVLDKLKLHLVVFVLEICSVRNMENISRIWFIVERGAAKAKIM